MRTPYTPHIFGERVAEKLAARRGWLTAGVASSITWPTLDVCIEYAGDDYFLRGSELNGKPSPPGITIACERDNSDEAISKIYRFTSILSWYMGGYVDVSGYVWGSHPNLYGDSRRVYSTLGIAGEKSFSCNHIPIIEDENTRKALAFWREGKRLEGVHASYSFLSFYKVIESQFSSSKNKVAWIEQAIEKLTGRAANRVIDLRSDNIDVSSHLYDSGRCAIAHASFDGKIVDPDIPADRRRLSDDLIVMEELARIYIREELKVPDFRSMYRERNRLESWDSLLPAETITSLSRGDTLRHCDSLHGLQVSISLWPDGAITGLENMTVHVEGVDKGVVQISLLNERKTIILVFFFDYKSGKAHTNLEVGGLISGEGESNEDDVRAYATFFYNVIANGMVELWCGDLDPIECEIVIPVNIIPMEPKEAIEESVKKFKAESLINAQV